MKSSNTHAGLPEAIPTPPALAAITNVDLVLLPFPATAHYGAVNAGMLFTPGERNEIALIPEKSRRQEKVAGKVAVKLLACTCLKRRFGVEATPSLIEVLSQPGPVTVRAPAAPRLDALLAPLFFSLSHTDGFVTAAAARQPVGVDIETIRPLTAAMTREIGGEPLLEAMAQLDSRIAETQRALLPLAVFTQKEAILKAAGLGLNRGLSALTLSDHSLTAPVEADCAGRRYRAHTAILPNCLFTLAHAIPPPGGKTVVPSATQEIMWLMNQVDGMGATHNVSFALRLQGPLNIDALARSIQALTNRHEALRTMFRDAGGRCEAAVLEFMETPLPIEHPGGDSSSAILNTARARCHEEMLRPFDLARPPLVRHTLFVLGPQDHLLLLVFHHTLIDATAVSAWRQDLAVCYREFHAGRIPVLPPIAPTFYDYIRRQRDQLTPDRIKELLDFWRSKLEGAPDQLTLPLDHPRPAYPTFDCDNVEFTLPGHLVDSLRALRAAEKVSLFVTILAAFQVFLLRLSRQDDVVIGIPFVDRRTPGTRNLVGCLVNLIPLRVSHAGAPRFRELLPRVQAAMTEALAHSDLPFPMLVETLAPRRRSSIPPVFQASILLSREETQGVGIEGLNQEYHHLPAGGTACDLNLYLTVGESGGDARFEYNRNLFEASTIRQWATQYVELLETIASNPDETLATLTRHRDGHPAILSGTSRVPSTERDLLLGDWSHEESEPRPVQCVHALFEHQAALTPAADAVIFEGRRLTYGQLNEQSNRIAHHLRSLGVGPESRVGLCVERSPEMIIGLLATLKAGGAYVPMDPAYPRERLAYMIQDAQPAVILTLSRLVPLLTDLTIPVVPLDTPPPEVARQSTGNPAAGVAPHTLAYIIYTSGSTGQPKGVLIEHRSLVNYTLAAITRYEITPKDRILQFASINFDASAEEIYPCLLAGATLVLRTEDMIATAATFLKRCAEWNLTLLDLPTAYWSHLTAQIDCETLSLPASIRLVIIGGESARPDRFAAWLDKAGRGVRLFNTYGPTETTIVATWCELTAHPAALAEQGRILPIGRPVPNARVYVLDPALHPVPISEAGELCIGGAGVARGYLNRDDLTRERFVPDPFDASSASQLYKTGDRVRFLPDGHLEFLGRQDHQVKLRGFRIELNEVEIALARHPGLLHTAVTVREDGPDDKRLVAYGVPADKTAPPAPDTLRTFLQQTLPEHMIPSAFVMLEQFPVGPNGKVDREALPAPTGDQNSKDDDTTKPRTLTEEILSAIWCEVLNVKQIGIHENFFDRGGHSLLGVRLITQIRESFHYDLPLRSLFQAPTIAGLAVLLDGSTKEHGTLAYLLDVQKGGSGTPLFFLPGGAGGESEFMVYARMMRQLGHNAPVYGFRIWGLDGRTKPMNSVKVMASTFIAELRTIQPIGPYFLAGECLGGVLAYEMARQLCARGDTIAFLGMLDSSCPTAHSFWQTFAGKLRPRMKQCWDRVFQIPKPRRLKDIGGAVRVTWNELGNDLGFVRSHPPPHESPAQRQLSTKKVGYTYIRTLLRYRPRPYDGKITMLLTDNFQSLCDPPEAWRAWARGGLDIHNIPGDHKNYVRDHAVTTGRTLGACLRQSAHTPS